MGIVIEDLEHGITKVALDGRLDILGAAAIDLPMSVVAGSRRAVVVDLEAVTFLSSMGLRTLVTMAQTLRTRGGRMWLLRPADVVRHVLITSGIDTMIPIIARFDEAASLT
jgi:stage II sporulation protein AA (anti-sigma F factor antagonist)